MIASQSGFHLMTYELEFHHKALKEWRKLDSTIKSQFKKKLSERLQSPKTTSAKPSGYSDMYKIKLRGLGYRLIYQVKDSRCIVYVITLGKREKSTAYLNIKNRINETTSHYNASNQILST